ncbi:hypothetical protein TYRP_005534 [Tyrophagus putrescentiae]|nr:hypothetical protein TYRP_005534 [Tyrophagus putrescentiae]
MASTWNKTIGIIILIILLLLITPAPGLISKPWSPWSARQTFSGSFDNWQIAQSGGSISSSQLDP